MNTGKEVLKQAGYDISMAWDEGYAAQEAVNAVGERFKIGDVVRIKSGGPDMTVVAVHPHYVEVSYYTERMGFERSSFPPDALVPTTASATSAE